MILTYSRTVELCDNLAAVLELARSIFGDAVYGCTIEFEPEMDAESILILSPKNG